MDDFTISHLDEWLSRHVYVEDIEALRADMVREYEDDPDYWDRVGWSALRDAVMWL